MDDEKIIIYKKDGPQKPQNGKLNTNNLKN